MISHLRFHDSFVYLNLLWNTFLTFDYIFFFIKIWNLTDFAKILTRWKTSQKYFFSIQCAAIHCWLGKNFISSRYIFVCAESLPPKKKNTMGTKLLQSHILMTQMASETFFKDLLKWFKVKKGTFNSCSLTNFQDFLFYLETTL